MSRQPSNQSYIKSIITTPWTTRTYLLTIIFFYVLNYFTRQWSYVNLSSNFFITILNYQVWRFFINFLYQPNIWVIVLMVLHLHNYMSKFVTFLLIKNSKGKMVFTIALLSQFFILCYEALIYLLNDNLIIDNWRVMFNIGAGGVFINMYFKFLWFNFKQPNRKCSCRAIFSLLYPLALIIVSSILSEQTRVDMVTAYILAVVECTIFRGGMIFFTADTYTEKQQIIRYIKLHKFPFCNFSLLNEEKIKPNRLGVVEAQQFYTLKGYTAAKSTQQLHEVQMQTQRGSFHNRSDQMVEDEISQQGKGEKWEQTQIVEDD